MQLPMGASAHPETLPVPRAPADGYNAGLTHNPEDAVGCRVPFDAAMESAVHLPRMRQ